MVFSLSLMLSVGVSTAFGHAAVTQKEVGVGQRQVFTVSVPNEEDIPTIALRLVLPEGLKSVTPNAKPGWTITLKREGEGADAKVTEISWTGGAIPAEQRDEFYFQAQAPAEETTLVWKTYQTYADGDVVAWENDPKVVAEYTKNNPPKEGEDDHSAPRPWSETKIINDLKASAQPQTKVAENSALTTGDSSIKWVSMIAIVLSIVSIGMQFYFKKK